MKKISVCFAINIVLFFSSLAQSLPEKYYRIQLIGSPKETIHHLAQFGVSIDHAHFSNERIITEVSESEFNLIKQSGVQYEVLIEDMTTYYQQRNQSSSEKIQFISNCEQFNFQKPSHFHLGSMGGFFTLNEMYQILDSMALLYPNLITVKQPVSSTNSIQGRPIYYVKISDNPNTNEPEPEVLYTALHHSREPASLSQLIFFMWYLLENYNTDPDVQFLINNTEMYFIPCVNPDGYEYNYSTNPNGGGMHRKNRRNNGDGTYGVDLNRNYGYMWGYDNTGSSPNTSSDTYRGTGPFSEPETQAVRDFCIAHQFVNALNAHTYSNLYIYPWGYIASYLTPDSTTFINWGKHLTREDRFLYGTGDQTVNYVTNGDSDDWMYGEQSTKNKIMSTTPEAGSANDGFWPPASRIIDICKTTLFQNIHFALLATNYAVVTDKQDNFISGNGFIKYNIQRLGVTGNGQFTVSLIPLSGMASTGPSKTYALSVNQSVNDSIAFTLSPLTNGQKIKYILAINNGFYSHYDTIQKVYGIPVTLLYDNGNSLSNWNTNGWGVTNSSSVSSPSSITDSPSGNYPNNANRYISLKNGLDLTNAVYAHLQYYTRFATEKNYDFVNIYISTNNGASWTALCSKYQTPPSSFGGTNPVYDGKQTDWVKEEIDLTPFVGNNVLFKFVLTSDIYGTEDGFYLDDFLVRKIVNTTGIIDLKNNLSCEILIYPNPAADDLNVLSNKDIQSISIYDLTGKLVYTQHDIHQKYVLCKINLSAGMYYVQIDLKDQNIYTKKIVISE